MSAPGIRRNLVWLCFAIAASTALLLVTARPATAQSDGAQLIGAQSHATWGSVSIADMRRELDLFAEAGANVVRADLAWSSLESEGNGQFNDWYIDRWDTFLAEAEARDLAVIATVLWTPCWASTAPDSEKQGCTGQWWDRDVTRYPPADPAELGDAMEFIGDRWGHRLAAIEVWNEPNLPEQRFLRAGNAAATYTTLLRSAYPRIKAVAPHLPVLGGVIAWSDAKFLEAMYDHGAQGHFDGLAMHPYNEWRDPNDPWQAEWRMFSFLQGVPAMHQVMSEHGDGEKKLWLTEFGWSTCTDGDRWCVSVPDQARFIADSIPIIRSWDFVAAATVYQMRDAAAGGCRECQFGMVRRDFTPKPSFAAFQKALGAVPSAQPEPHVHVNSGPRVKLRGRVAVGIRVRCKGPRGARCAGKLSLGSRKGRLGARQFSVASRRSSRITVHLNRRGARLAHRHGRLRATAKAKTRETGRSAKRFTLLARS